MRESRMTPITASRSRDLSAQNCWIASNRFPSDCVFLTAISNTYVKISFQYILEVQDRLLFYGRLLSLLEFFQKHPISIPIYDPKNSFLVFLRFYGSKNQRTGIPRKRSRSPGRSSFRSAPAEETFRVKSRSGEIRSNSSFSFLETCSHSRRLTEPYGCSRLSKTISISEWLGLWLTFNEYSLTGKNKTSSRIPLISSLFTVKPRP